MAVNFNYFSPIKKSLVSVKQEFFFYCLELIQVCSHPLICPSSFPKVSAEKIHYYGKVLGGTDFIDLVSCTGWSMVSFKLNNLKALIHWKSIWLFQKVHYTQDMLVNVNKSHLATLGGYDCVHLWDRLAIRDRRNEVTVIINISLSVDSGQIWISHYWYQQFKFVRQ